MENVRTTEPDLIEEIPDPDTVRAEIRESVTRTEMLRGLLRLSLKKAARDRAGREEVTRAGGH
jgi:hypothetical protein